MKLYKETNKGAKNAIDETGNSLMGVPAIVADNKDDERQRRVRVIIPSIDEDMIFDEWARQIIFCLGNGFGSAFIPPKGSEVVLFGQLGQKYNLFYASLYNEEMLVPAGYNDELTVGIHAPKDLIFIAEQLAKMQANNIELIAAQVAKMLANTIEINAQATALLKGNATTVEAAGTNLIKGSQVNLQGNITISNGNIKINGGNVEIKGSSVKIHGRTVKKAGPPI